MIVDLPGRVFQTAYGSSYLLEKTYPLTFEQGNLPLHAWLGCEMQAVGMMTGEDRFNTLAPQDFLFLDIETSDLGDFGTLPFMIGVGFFRDDAYHLQQYFLREPEEEAAQLDALLELFYEHPALVTFNGKHFDVPIVEKRLRINRFFVKLSDWLHVDLYRVAKQIWKNRGHSLGLKTLEKEMLGVQRTDEDVPGQDIPGLYHHFLNTGDALPMQQVAYHNELDVVSMVTLASTLTGIFQNPVPHRLPTADVLGLAHWYHQRKMRGHAVDLLKRALAEDRPDNNVLLGQLSVVVDKLDAEIVRHMEDLAAIEPENPVPPSKLARYYESKDKALALAWAERAYHAWEQQPTAPIKGAQLTALGNRIRRLRRQLA